MDPDGELIGEPPIEVSCIFDEGDGAITMIHNMNEGIIPVDHCDSLQCFEKSITYPVSVNQIKALKDISSTCTQYISFGCILAPLENDGNFFGAWKDINGKFIELTQTYNRFI